MELDWKVLSRDDTETVLFEVNPYLGEFVLPPVSSRVRVASLPFYREFRFYELTDLRGSVPKSMFALRKHTGGTDATFVMDWTNRPIYTANNYDLNLDHTNLHSYLGFFFACVQGPYGQMTVVEKLEPTDDVSEDVYFKTEALQRFTPPRIVGRTIGGGYIVKAAILFKDRIFLTKVKVGRTGLIQVVDHELMIDGLESQRLVSGQTL